MSRDDPQMKLRLPEALRDRIRDAADENGRSLNAEIVNTLSRAYPREGGAIDFARDLFGIYMFHAKQMGQTDSDLIEELFEGLFNEIRQLEEIKDNYNKLTNAPDPT
ncbi:Arc family DNA-binding protein [Methylobacterium sp. P1-11]|uniref:Arc family DNA-binding protein n=1 Tax=Methylobacterium sp. P1-11 TaxID=2024616 RepID=UPI0011EFBA4E|nr:Arc family DNA-binding protein [Methylobacterium sp. P1-11]KAA0117926.1 Arc family DNA-binding protein [Methylobacterium sp. P1-11]